jgi:hypothetical protein
MAIAAAKSAAAGASKLAPAPSAAASLASMLPGSSAGSCRSLVQAGSGSSGSNSALSMLADTAVAATNGRGGGGCLSTAPSTASCATLTAELCHTCSNCQLGEDSNSSWQVTGAGCHHHSSGSGIAGGRTSEDAEMLVAPELSDVDPGSALARDAEAEAEADNSCCSGGSSGDGGAAARGMPPSPFAARQLGTAAPGAPARPSLLSLPSQLGVAGMQLEEAAWEPPGLPPAPLLGIQAALDAEAAQLAAKYGVRPEQQGRQTTRSRLGPAGASRLLAEAGAATAGSSDDMRLQKTGQRNRIVAYIHRQKASVLRTFNRFPHTRGGASSGSGSDDDGRPPAAAQ